MARGSCIQQLSASGRLRQGPRDCPDSIYMCASPFADRRANALSRSAHGWVPTTYAQPRRAKAAVHLMALYAFDRMRRLRDTMSGKTSALTPREREVLAWIGAGKSAAQIGQCLENLQSCSGAPATRSAPAAINEVRGTSAGNRRSVDFGRSQV